MIKQALEHTSFSELAERACALYSEENDQLLLAMLGQEYCVGRSEITLRGQKAPDLHAAIILDYLLSRGTSLIESPWRSLGDFTGLPGNDFRKRIEVPLAQHVPELLSRADQILPLIDAKRTQSIIGGDLVMIVRALPKVFLHVEMMRENQEFPAESWVLYSNNANEFLSGESLQVLAELFKDRLLSLLRIY